MKKAKKLFIKMGKKIVNFPFALVGLFVVVNWVYFLFTAVSESSNFKTDGGPDPVTLISHINLPFYLDVLSIIFLLLWLVPKTRQAYFDGISSWLFLFFKLAELLLQVAVFIVFFISGLAWFLNRFKELLQKLSGRVELAQKNDKDYLSYLRKKLNFRFS